MYCIIEKKIKRKPNKYGKCKRYEVFSNRVGDKTIYSYKESEERYTRDRLDSYKVMLKQSYRENGKVKQYNFVVETYDFYALVNYPEIGLWNDRLLPIVKKIPNVNLDKCYDLIYKKLDPLMAELEKQWKETEEYKGIQENKIIIQKYKEAQKVFQEEYNFHLQGKPEFNEIFDVYLNIRNQKLLDQMKYLKRAYYERNGDYSANKGTKQEPAKGHSEGQKEHLRMLKRKLATVFHPDAHPYSKHKDISTDIFQKVNGFIEDEIKK